MDKKTKLKIWDFDGTLVDSPLPTDENKALWKEATGKDWEHIGWWSKVESLDKDIFDIPALPSVIDAFRIHKADADCMNVMLTGRRAKKPLEDAVKDILHSKSLMFDHYFHNNGGETGENKMYRMEKLLKTYPTLESISMYDDRDSHIPRFKEWGEKLVSEGRLKEFEMIHVTGGELVRV